MREREFTYIDKSKYAIGAWTNEPDKIIGIDEFSKLPYMVIRANYFGFLYGYVGVDSTHPFYGKKVSEIECYVTAHDLTTTLSASYSTLLLPKEEFLEKIELDDENELWWIGFDCGHFGETCPFENPNHGKYSDVEDVEEECLMLSRFLKSKNEASFLLS